MCCFVLKVIPRQEKENSLVHSRAERMSPSLVWCPFITKTPQTTTNYNAHLDNHPRCQVITTWNQAKGENKNPKEVGHIALLLRSRFPSGGLRPTSLGHVKGEYPSLLTCLCSPASNPLSSPLPKHLPLHLNVLLDIYIYIYVYVYSLIIW